MSTHVEVVSNSQGDPVPVRSAPGETGQYVISIYPTVERFFCDVDLASLNRGDVHIIGGCQKPILGGWIEKTHCVDVQPGPGPAAGDKHYLMTVHADQSVEVHQVA